jgi:5'(3')-deoxyribonucleotidase
MKVNFDKEESVLRALKVMGLAESVVRELRSQK